MNQRIFDANGNLIQTTIYDIDGGTVSVNDHQGNIVTEAIEAGLLTELIAEREFIDRRLRLSQAVATLRSWADDAEATTATSGNAVATLNVVIDRLGIFFDRFADLLEDDGRFN